MKLFSRASRFRSMPFSPALLSLLLLLGCSSGSGSVKKDVASTADPTNPFPEKILGHRVFLIFRSTRQNLLGYTMRPGLEKLQVFGAKYWQGKERPGTGPGENRTIVFNRKQARRVGAALPGIGFNNSYKGEVSFKLILKGLRVSQLNVPVLEEEYRDLPEARTSPFVVSLLSADEVLIQALVKEAGGTRVGSRADTRAVFSGDVRYSESANGVIAGRKRIIGYILSRPRSEDLARRATGESYRRLGIFDLDDKTGHPDFAFLSSTMRHKLEEAFQSIPKFHVVTERKEAAKYHLKGSYSRIGSRVQIELGLRNTYNQELVHKVVRAIKADDIDTLYDYQLTMVKDFARKFGVELKAEDKQRLKSVVRQARNLDRLKEFRLARSYFEKGDFKKCEAAARKLTDRDERYLDAWVLHANCIIQLSRFQEARPIVKHALNLALAADNPSALARAYQIQGWLLVGLNDRAGSLASRRKGLEVLKKAYGNSHPKTADFYTVVGWGRYLAASHQKTPEAKRAMLKRAEQDYLYNLNIMKSHFGPDDARLIPTYGGLGNIQMRLKKPEAAITNAHTSLRLSKKHLGLDHPFTGRRKNDLGTFYRKQKRFDEALELFQRAEKVFARALGADVTLQRAVNYTSLGILYYQQKQYRKALEWRLRNLRAYKKMFGHLKEHPYVHSSHRRVGNALLRLDDIRGALRHWRLGRGLHRKMSWLGRHLRRTLWVSAKNGDVPKGALAIGPDYNKKTLYACRVQVESEVYFGKVRPAYGACNYAFGGREIRAKEYQVLVLKNKPLWEKAEDGEIRDSWRIVDVAFYSRKKSPPKTGAPNNTRKKKQDAFLYLCRAKYQGSTVIGEVRPGRTQTCRFGYGGVAYGSVQYEVLAEKVAP